mmetsp:Transcript_131924/g.367800  ORF Transcript_131924/g.367800 Transcript_131924/m.367800 type:complete len:502 (-) Transcript_131924:98-1603(-)
MLCGTDLDEALAYHTPKITVLKDRKLGLIAISLKLLIFSYIVLWTILYKGKHLKSFELQGLHRLSIRHPTEHLCNVLDADCNSNFTDYTELPYCSESQKTYTHTEQKKRCSTWDYLEAGIPLDEGMLVATRVRRFDEKRDCAPSQDNGWACTGAPFRYVSTNGTRQRKSGAAVPKIDKYVADIEHYTLLIDHRCTRADGDHADDRDDRSMLGYVEECTPSGHAGATGCTQQPIPCISNKCPAGSVEPSEGEPQSKRALASGILASGSAVSTRTGDVFTLGALLRLANIDLDRIVGEAENLRTRGLVLVIKIGYDNRPAGGFLGLKVGPWNMPEIRYSYKIVPLQGRHFHTGPMTVADPNDNARVERIFSGVRLVVEQGGTIVTFDLSFFLVTVTTALGLLVVANSITDMVMMYLLPRSAEYTQRKFFVSKDMNPDEQTGVADHDKHLDAVIDALHAQDREALKESLPILVAGYKRRTSVSGTWDSVIHQPSQNTPASPMTG